MEDRRPLILRVLLIGLLFAAVLLQARLWVSDDGFIGVQRLSKQVELQRQENAELNERNQRLEAEVLDLKKGFTALEERARSDLGLISPNETFFVFGNTGDLDSDAAP